MSSKNTSVSSAQIAQSDAAGIHIDNLTHQFDTDQGQELVFEDVSVEIDPGSFVTLVGKSGSGKSTMMNIMSGILSPTEGSVWFEVNGTRKDDITIGHVFQSPRLLPWETCIDNIEYVHEDNDDFSEEIAKEYLDLVDLSKQYDSYPTRLSGGQKQRVGIARALSIDPEILLMDEPFSDLDEITAEGLRKEIIDIWQTLGKTVFFVTHDMTEAVQLSDRILMLGNGRIYEDMSINLDRPRDISSEEFIKVRQEAVSRFHSVDDGE